MDSQAEQKLELERLRAAEKGAADSKAIIDAIKPKGEGDALTCWKCDAALTSRGDDLDVAAIDKRLDIYFDEENGTLASFYVIEKWALARQDVKLIKIDGARSIAEINDELSAHFE